MAGLRAVQSVYKGHPTGCRTYRQISETSRLAATVQDTVRTRSAKQRRSQSLNGQAQNKKKHGERSVFWLAAFGTTE